MLPRPRPARAVTLIAALALLAVSPHAAGAPLNPVVLTAQPTAVDFGLVPVDWSEQGGSVTVENDGLDDVTMSSATIDGDGAFRVTNDGCQGLVLSSGSSCTVNIGFDPPAGAAYAATLHVPGDGGEAAVPLAGVGGAQQVTATPAELDFGAVDVGDAAVRSLTFANTGNLPFQSIVAIPTGVDVGAFRVVRDTCSLQQLNPGDSCELAVRFAPTGAASATATLMVIGGNGSPALIPLHGSGMQATALLAPGTLDFGTQAVKSPGAVKAVNLVNVGSGTLRVSTVALAGRDAGQFRLAGEDCIGVALAPAASCAVRVRFVPGEAGTTTAQLRLGTNDAAGVASVRLDGRALAATAPAAIAPADVAFDRRVGSPAPFANGRAALGTARCVGAPRCWVSVRARVYGKADSARARTVVWRPGDGMRVALPLADELDGMPLLVVARLRTHAAGRPSSLRTIVVRLVPAS